MVWDRFLISDCSNVGLAVEVSLRRFLGAVGSRYMLFILVSHMHDAV